MSTYYNSASLLDNWNFHLQPREAFENRYVHRQSTPLNYFPLTLSCRYRDITYVSEKLNEITY